MESPRLAGIRGASDAFRVSGDATKYGDYCMQEEAVPMRSFREGGSEDCLYLNVFMPEEAQNLTGLPCGSEVDVGMVWIHGGAYESGKSDLYDPSNITELLRSKGLPAILVTINYRLNVFGFLGSGSLATRDATGSTGNYGIQDQRMALQWVQNNIAAFGGDPQKASQRGDDFRAVGRGWKRGQAANG
ncbi:unnamed protein product [Effrenium voratum]|nr:unnamed protein product [Effrenium voratum]